MPTRQRAVAVRLAHTRAQLREGKSAWLSCDVIPWPAWLERCAAQQRHGALAGFRRLGATEEWVMWREIAEACCADLPLLRPGTLADALRRSSARARDFGLHWTGSATAESALFHNAQRLFEQRCQELHAYSGSDWIRVLRDFPAVVTPLVFAGFAGIGHALRARLEQLGASLWPPEADKSPSGSWEAVGCADPTDELRAAACWCRDELGRNADARLLVVDTQLGTRRAQAVQAFEHELRGGELLAPQGEALYGIEGGQPLADYALVEAALDLLQLSGGVVQFPQLAALLRSPYIGCGTRAQRSALELSLRERNVTQADIAQLCTLAGSARFPAAQSLAGALLATARAWGSHSARTQDAAGWAQEFAARLEAGGWPGNDALGSEELQQSERLRELLGELSTLGAGGGRLSFREALELLQALVHRTSFEVATPDVPVTVTESVGDPLIEYDGIWVAGLGAESWPAPPRPDPFIPIGVQRSAGYPPASAHGQLDAARRAIAAWERRTRRLVLSWPWAEGDVPLQPSWLLGVATQTRTAIAPARSDGLIAALRQSARREPRPAERALGWRTGLRLPGGTKVLQLQALCPFKAVAEMRLGALSVPEPRPGLDRAARGQLLHRALQLVFEQIKDSRELQLAAADAAGLLRRVAAACDWALRELLAPRAQRLSGALVVNEKRRLTRLIEALLRQELARAESGGFTIGALEVAQDLELAGFPIRVRMDRVDRLDDGRLIVLDYKSGAPQAFRPLDERPRQAQLLAYAVLSRGAVAGVSAVHLGTDGVCWRGAAAEPALLPGLGRARAPTAPWPDLMLHWRRVVEKLARSYVAGVSTVDPLPGACLSCALPALCRVDARRRQEPDPELAEASGGGGETDGG